MRYPAPTNPDLRSLHERYPDEQQLLQAVESANPEEDAERLDNLIRLAEFRGIAIRASETTLRAARQEIALAIAAELTELKAADARRLVRQERLRLQTCSKQQDRGTWRQLLECQRVRWMWADNERTRT